MHLRGYPKYYVKNGKRRPVYYTAEARDLTAMGWRPEEAAAVPKEKPAKPPVKLAEPVEKIEVEVVQDEAPASKEEELPDFEFMTKPELIKFAADHGETLSSADLKADLVEACKKLVRARDEDGRFLADDPSTPDVNEAWTIG